MTRKAAARRVRASVRRTKSKGSLAEFFRNSPLAGADLEPIWRKIEKRGVTEKDVEDAVRWARKRR